MTTSPARWRLLVLALFAFVAGPVLAQTAESTEEFQRQRREIEARWLAANNSGDDAGKAAAAAELRALGLDVPAAATPNPETENETWWEHLIRRLREIFGIDTPPASGGNTGLGTGGNTQPPPADFRVIVERNDGTALTGTAAEFLVGEKVELRARVEPLAAGGTAPSISSWQWTIPGSTIKSYALDLDASQSNLWSGRSGQTGAARHMNSLSLTQASLADADKRAQTISFYWTSDGQGRRVTCTARAANNAEATGEATINVRRSENPARDLYTNAAKFSGNWPILENHDAWHDDADGFYGTDRFIYFHREFLRGYTLWRQLFGYPPHVAVQDIGQPGGGIAKPSYLTAAGGTETSQRHSARRLGDFASASDLGDDLENPWHDFGHGAESGRTINGSQPNRDMRSTLHATKCEVFYMWHQKIDDVALEYGAR